MALVLFGHTYRLISGRPITPGQLMFRSNRPAFLFQPLGASWLHFSCWNSPGRQSSGRSSSTGAMSGGLLSAAGWVTGALKSTPRTTVVFDIARCTQRHILLATLPTKDAGVKRQVDRISEGVAPKRRRNTR